MLALWHGPVSPGCLPLGNWHALLLYAVRSKADLSSCPVCSVVSARLHSSPGASKDRNAELAGGHGCNPEGGSAESGPQGGSTFDMLSSHEAHAL
jgi:hypothetical protein